MDLHAVFKVVTMISGCSHAENATAVDAAGAAPLDRRIPALVGQI
jgi:hypothetical protein